ncbi:Spc7-domain-containing protein [Thozetella sp. PMI_491]|nr:Spc7-domain-containing protein [Thozetella sp. PMI_491]
MPPQGEVTLPATRRARKSVGASPTRKAKDKENATIDMGSTMAAARKKSRSKSMGPGTLDVLKTGSGNRRASLAVPSRPPPRSILKPTMPLLPDIPPHKPKKSGGTPGSGPGKSGADNGDDNSGTKIALRTEEEQQAAAREREERERAQLEKEINDHREARRKSLANRRVSFAAEATLHTFHEIEYMQDSTTSTDSTRRASSVASRSPAAPQTQSETDPSDPPSTPPEQAEDRSPESPGDQRSLHQRKHRRSSGMFSEADDVTVASTTYSDDSEHGDDVQSVQGEILSGSEDSDEEDGTMMTVEAEEMTMASIASARSGFSVDSTDLDENLRLAVQHASTQRIDEDEEIIAGFAGWGKKTSPQESARHDQENAPSTRAPEPASMGLDDEGSDMDMDMDMEMTNAVGGILNPRDASPEKDDDMSMEMSMDVTQAYGAIIPESKPPTRRKSVRLRAQPSEEPTSPGDQTMDFTMAVGGIQHGRTSDGSQADTDGNEDMSMELTTAMGAVLSGNKLSTSAKPNRRRTLPNREQDDAVADMTMDMTIGVGRILPSASHIQDEDDQTMGMDMTMAAGGITEPETPAQARSAAKKVMEQEVDKPDASVTASLEITSPSRKSAPATASGAATPGLSMFKGRGLRRSPARAASPPKSLVPESLAPESPALKSPAKSPVPVESSPLIAATPKRKAGSRSSHSPNKTPIQSAPAAMIGSQSSSPVRQASPTGRTTPRSASKRKAPQNSVFQQDPATGVPTPRVILTPQRRTPQPRRLSGVGIDRAGLGSPRVAEIFGRRGSLADVSPEFVPGRKAVAFADPRAMEQEVDRERQAEEDKENSRKILEREADGSPNERELTLNLKEMIQELSPKKNPLKGRKSLHVGSARGLLGKRPAELDGDEEPEERDGVKRLKGHQGSPVKNIRLGAPPSKNETTTGRKTRSSAKADDDTTTPTVSGSPKKASSPIRQGRFRTIENDDPTTMSLSFSPLRNPELEAEDGEDRIHLQDFLNMTSIRFMELTTTKRRHTVAPSARKDTAAADSKDDVSLERCVVAGACTVPMLELYQHSCRELKKYISEGRRIVREIETETFEENPPLFREYMEARPDFKILMDNQFKNVKTHARLLSKAMWYEWRMKLQDGLKEGLVKIGEGMDTDNKTLDKQQDLLASVLPALLDRFEQLEEEHGNLEAVAQELENCDPAELQGARLELVAAEDEIEMKMKKIAELRQQLEESEAGVETLVQQKHQCLEEIQEAEKIREECRGWSSTEINALKAKVSDLEEKHGWAITGIAGTTVSMTYRREIELVFDVAAFQPDSNQDSPIDLWYIAANRERCPIPATPEKDFMLQCIRDAVRALPQAQTAVKDMLGIVRSGWDKTNALAKHVRILNVAFPTQVSRTSDSSIAIKSTLLLTPLKSKVEVVLALHSQVSEQGVEVSVTPQASVVYGEQFNPVKITDFLSGKVSDRITAGTAGQSSVSWGEAVAELHAKLLAKGRK